MEKDIIASVEESVKAVEALMEKEALLFIEKVSFLIAKCFTLILLTFKEILSKFVTQYCLC